MQMWSRRSAGRSDERDQFALLYFLADLRDETVKVPVPRSHTVAMVDDEQIAICSHPLGIDDFTVSRRPDLRSVQRRNIESEMHFGITVERIGAVSVMTRDRPLDRPQVRSAP